MVALVFEIYGAFCLFSLIAFLVLASVAKLRPDLEEEELDLAELEKLVNSEPSGDALSIEPAILEESSLVAAVPSGKAEQASDPEASAPDSPPQAAHHLISAAWLAMAQLCFS